MDRLRQDTTEKTTIAVVADLVQDWGLELDAPISGSTMLVADLEFASVDIIQLCVALEQSYERKLAFHDLLMRNGSYVGDLSIAQVAAHVESKLQ